MVRASTSENPELSLFFSKITPPDPSAQTECPMPSSSWLTEWIFTFPSAPHYLLFFHSPILVFLHSLFPPQLTFLSSGLSSLRANYFNSVKSAFVRFPVPALAHFCLFFAFLLFRVLVLFRFRFPEIPFFSDSYLPFFHTRRFPKQFNNPPHGSLLGVSPFSSVIFFLFQGSPFLQQFIFSPGHFLPSNFLWAVPNL